MRKLRRLGLKAALLAAVTLLHGLGSAIGDERAIARSAKALDALCISTQLDSGNLDVRVQSFVHRKLLVDSVRKLSPDNEAGYAVIIDRTPITVTLGRKTLDDEISRNCTITIENLAFSDAAGLLETKYAAKELNRFTHGLSQIAVYRATLDAYPADMFFSVQSGSGLTALSFFETPSTDTD